MNTARDNSTCLRLERWLNAYIDDELDAVHCLEVEDHLENCAECAERIDHLRATRASLRNALKTPAPSALRDRISKIMAEELAAQERHGDAGEEAPLSMQDVGGSVRPAANETTPLSSLRYVVPLAAVATIALVFGVMQLDTHETTARTDPAPSMYPSIAGAEAQMASLDTVIDDLLDDHIHSPPLDTTSEGDVGELERHVGFRPYTPHLDKARWLGARVRQRHRAAMMRYVTSSKERITLYMFNTSNVKMRTGRLRHRPAAQVYVGNIRGYNVAAAERDGVGFAVASELDQEQVTSLLVAAVRR